MSGIAEDITVITGVAILVGIVGIVVPVLPGTLLIGGAVLVWALVVQTTAGWVALAVVAVLLGAGQVLQYYTAARHMTSSGVPRRTLVVAGLAAIPGFFLVPVVGLVLFFVAALFVAERLRLGTTTAAWRSSVVALKAVGLAILIELAAGLLAAGAWLYAALSG